MKDIRILTGQGINQASVETQPQGNVQQALSEIDKLLHEQLLIIQGLEEKLQLVTRNIPIDNKAAEVKNPIVSPSCCVLADRLNTLCDSIKANTNLIEHLGARLDL